MSDQEFIRRILGKDKTKWPKFIRRHHCQSPRCHLRTILAYQLTDDIESIQGDFYQVKDCVWVRGQPHLIYEKKMWFGNMVRCPVCGTLTKLLIDQPLSWERIEEPKKENVHAS